MKKTIAVVMIAVICFLVNGCIFVPTSQSTVHKWQSCVNEWLPVGTPAEEISRIMKQHGFAPTGVHDNSMSFDKDTGFNWIWVHLYVVNGKLASPPVTAVSRSGNM